MRPASRVLVALGLSFVALPGAVAGVWISMLGSANRAWDAHFLGEPTALSTALFHAGWVSTVFASIHILFVGLWFAGRRRGAYGLLVTNTLLMMGMPWPVALVMAIASWSIIGELFIRRDPTASGPGAAPPPSPS